MRATSLTCLTMILAGAAWVSVYCDEKKSDPKAAAKAAAEFDAAGPGEKKDPDDAVKEIVSGKVVMLVDALKERGIKSYAEEIKGHVVLVTPEKELIPIVADWRGRAFYQDERLRNRPVDLIVNRRPGVPWVQVLSIFTFDEKGERNITDYWCDICAIPMYEIKDCECCQGPTRLRFRPQELPKDVPARKSK
ncbi:MAG: hypothetical protein HY290_11685 [Planctomycetia bacterium]|nr:hypothetical protein [Planctomycetia bacterium]